MDLLLVRHAIAEDPSPDLPDEARVLTLRGRRRFRASVQGLAALSLQVELILHSPKLRAVETADLLAPVLVKGGRKEETPLLAAPPSAALLALLDAPRAAVVGHEPHISALLALLLTGRPEGDNFSFKKGGVAWLEGAPHPGGMALRAVLPPAVLRRLMAEPRS